MNLSACAIISCVHGNLEAFEAVLEDIERRGIQDIVCLGDLTGFGPDPARCVDLAMERCGLTLLGNHDESLVALGRFGLTSPRFQDYVRFATADIGGVEGARGRFLRSLPLAHGRGKTRFVHGSPRDPTCEHILPDQARSEAFMAAIFACVGDVLFVGHTHIPGMIIAGQPHLAPGDLGGSYGLASDRKAIVNVGSVGQPRDGDPRACYVSASGDRIEWHRVPYDIEATARKIRSRDLDASFALRLAAGR